MGRHKTRPELQREANARAAAKRKVYVDKVLSEYKSVFYATYGQTVQIEYAGCWVNIGSVRWRLSDVIHHTNRLKSKLQSDRFWLQEPS